MFALVEIAGSQFEARPNDVIQTPLLKGEPGEEIVFDKVLLYDDGDNVQIGEPYVEGTVTAKILRHGKDKKVLVFHKKRRKGYQKLNGHRQRFSEIEILSLNLGGKNFEATKAEAAEPRKEEEIAENEENENKE